MWKLSEGWPLWKRGWLIFWTAIHHVILTRTKLKCAWSSKAHTHRKETESTPEPERFRISTLQTSLSPVAPQLFLFQTPRKCQLINKPRKADRDENDLKPHMIMYCWPFLLFSLNWTWSNTSSLSGTWLNSAQFNSIKLETTTEGYTTLASLNFTALMGSNEIRHSPNTTDSDLHFWEILIASQTLSLWGPYRTWYLYNGRSKDEHSEGSDFPQTH